MLESWETFLSFKYANEILMGVGGVAALVSVLKIIGSSIKLLLWVVLAAIGLFLLNFGFDRSPYADNGSLRDRVKLENISLKDIDFEKFDWKKSLAEGSSNKTVTSLRSVCSQLDDL